MRLSRSIVAAALLITAANVLAAPAAGAHYGPARGQPIDQLAGLLVATTWLVVAFWYVAWRHLEGRGAMIRALARRSTSLFGGTASDNAPMLVAGTFLPFLVFGFYWDVSIHIDRGRDPNLFANPAHWFAAIGLLGLSSAGAIGIVLAREDAGSWRIPRRNWALFACGAVSFLGFVLDELWHRIAGQDVSLWGPGHLIDIGCASLTPLVLLAMARSTSPKASMLARALPYLLAGGVAVGFSDFQGEYDFGVAQYRQMLHPILLVAIFAFALVLGRILLGPSSTVAIPTFFLMVRGTIALIVGPVAGRTVPHFPLVVGCALAVEFAARLVPTRRSNSFVAVAGVLIGSLGIATEDLWVRLTYRIPWSAAMLLRAAPLWLVASIAAAYLGLAAAHALQGKPSARKLSVAGAVAVIACVVCVPAAYQGSTPRIVASLHFADSTPTSAVVVARISPARATDRAIAFGMFAWQGGGSLVSPMLKIGEGTYVTRTRVPMAGPWKSLLRLEVNDRLLAAPIYMPADPAIPAAAYPPREGEVSFVPERRFIQREGVVVPWYDNVIAYGVAFALLASLGAAVATSLGPDSQDLGDEESRAPRQPSVDGRFAYGLVQPALSHPVR